MAHSIDAAEYVDELTWPSVRGRTNMLIDNRNNAHKLILLVADPWAENNVFLQVQAPHLYSRN